MSEAASKPAPVGRLRVAIHAVDLPRRSALSRVVVEAGHVVVGAQDAADVVLADRDCPPGETRPVVMLGGTDRDLPGVLIDTEIQRWFSCWVVGQKFRYFTLPTRGRTASAQRGPSFIDTTALRGL